MGGFPAPGLPIRFFVLHHVLRQRQTIAGQSGATSVTTGLIAGLQRDHAAMLNGLTVRTASLWPAAGCLSWQINAGRGH